MSVREGAWDCPMCGAKRNRGPHKHCGKCGAKRDPSVEFYLPDDAREVTEEEELKRAAAGPDWACPYCMAESSADDKFCGNCGADPHDPMWRKTSVTPVAELPAAPSRSLARPLGLGCLGMLLVLALFLWLGAPKRAQAQVSALEWQRVIHVESYGTVSEEGWEGELPPGARVLGRRRDLHHVNHVQVGYDTHTVSKQVQSGTKKVKTGTKNMGNGYFQDVYREEPVYRTVQETVREPRFVDQPVYRLRLRYEVERWKPSRDLQRGATDANPRWPDFVSSPREREASRSEAYRVIFSDANGRYTYTAPGESQWRAFRVGQSCSIKVSGGKVTEILNS